MLAMSHRGAPRTPLRILYPLIVRIIISALISHIGASRNVTSFIASTNVPPSPNIQRGPNFASLTAPRITSTPPFAILIPLMQACFGAYWSLWLGGFDLNPVGFMGIIILIGIVVNNGIVLVDHVNSLRVSGVERRQALIEGCGDRLRPVVMTAITTIFGLIPLVVARATVAGTYIDSIAVVVIGGLATSTIFTLLALPVWYTTLEDVGAAVLRALPKRQVDRNEPLGEGGVLADLD